MKKSLPILLMLMVCGIHISAKGNGLGAFIEAFKAGNMDKLGEYYKDRVIFESFDYNNGKYKTAVYDKIKYVSFMRNQYKSYKHYLGIKTVQWIWEMKINEAGDMIICSIYCTGCRGEPGNVIKYTFKKAGTGFQLTTIRIPMMNGL